jgi:NAD(P)-dependent dehydrogenase (short-subunit alcohol dehydrogenase family)
VKLRLFTGIGLAVAKAFVAAGCSGVALVDLNEAGVEAVAAIQVRGDTFSHGQRNTFEQKIHTYGCDISNEASVVSTFEKIRRDFGRVDYAVNCAGVNATGKPSAELSADQFDRVLAVNLRGSFLCSREEIRTMKAQSLDADVYPGIPAVRGQRGSVVNIASGLGVVSMPNTPEYCAAKAGVMGLTRSDAVDYAAHRIRVNAVLPGATMTAMSHGNEEYRIAVEALAVDVLTPMRRWGRPEEIADACLFLCSNRASFVQGVSMPVDGGYLAM